MNLDNYYWYFESVIPHRICDDIIKYGNQLKEKMAVTGDFGNVKEFSKKQINDLKKKRNSNIVGILIGIILNLVNLQNIKKDNFMIGTVMLGLYPIINLDNPITTRLENYLLPYLYQIQKIIQVEN